jgi:hypothetical protein
MKHQTLYGSLLAVGIIAVIICVGMATGFSGMNPFVSRGPVSTTNTAALSVPTGNTVADPVQYIIIDPVSAVTTGDLLTVTGTTNLPAGTVLMVRTGSFGGDTLVRAGSGGVNRFSAPVDTSFLKPGTEMITVVQMTGDITKGDYRPGAVNGTTSFTLRGTYLGSDTPVSPEVSGRDFITLNPIADHSVGDQFLVTGTTSLPIGTNILWQVIPESETPLTGLSHTAQSGIMANNGVTKGDSTTNRVSLAVDTGNLKPGKYVAMAAILKGDMTTGNVEMGDLSGSAWFTIR